MERWNRDKGSDGRGSRDFSVTWNTRRHQLLPDRVQGFTKARKIWSLRARGASGSPPASVFSVRFKGEKYSEKPIWERVSLLPGSPRRLSRLLGSPPRLQMTL